MNQPRSFATVFRDTVFGSGSGFGSIASRASAVCFGVFRASALGANVFPGSVWSAKATRPNSARLTAFRSRGALGLLAVLAFVGAMPSARAEPIKDLALPFLDELNDDQRQVFYRVVNHAACPCNCPLTLAACLKHKPKCGKSTVMARFAARMTQKGLTTLDIETELTESFTTTAQPMVFKKDAPNGSTKGKPGAKIQIVEFADFRCHHCREASHFVSELTKALGDKIEVTFKHYPLQSQEPSVLAAEAAEAAGAQGKFWPYHDLVFAHQEAVAREDLIRYAEQLKLDVKRFTKELDERKYKAKVMADREEGTKAGLQGTPGFFLNGRELRLERTLDNFKDRIEFEQAAEAMCTQ